MSEPPAGQNAVLRHRWTDLEDSLLMEVYPRSRVAGGELGWAEIADLMNTNSAARGIEVKRTFRENTVRSHWNDHQNQLLERYGIGDRVAAAAANTPTPASNPSGAPYSRAQSMEHAVTANTPPINHHTVGPVGWMSDPLFPRRSFSGWNPINRGATPTATRRATTIPPRSQSNNSENHSTTSALRENENIAAENNE